MGAFGGYAQYPGQMGSCGTMQAQPMAMGGAQPMGAAVCQPLTPTGQHAQMQAACVPAHQPCGYAPRVSYAHPSGYLSPTHPMQPAVSPTAHYGLYPAAQGGAPGATPPAPGARAHPAMCPPVCGHMPAAAAYSQQAPPDAQQAQLMAAAAGAPSYQQPRQ